MDENRFDDLYALLSNEKVHKYFPRALDKKESREFLHKVQRGYEEYGFGFWAVIRKEDDTFLGICGLLKQVIDETEELEVGYRFNDQYWGRGYGTEAAAGCMEYAEKVLKKKNIISLIRAINTQSVRVAEKNGLKLEKEVIFYGLPHRVYRKWFGKTK